LLVALVLIQFYRPERNINPNTTADDIVNAYSVPADVASVLHKACYDCHSNNTNYPWYNNFQPVALWLDDHVREGKDELNFSEYGSFKTKRKLKKLKEIVKEVEEGEMPLDSYTWIHGEAKLTAAEKQLLIDWAKGLSTKITMEAGAMPQ
jgi:exonuclease VII small subunit